MIKPGEYRTRGGHTAIVKWSNPNGAIGFIYIPEAGGESFPMAWSGQGLSFNNEHEDDLDLPPTIKIPEIELPEPMRVYEPKVYPVFENADTVISLKIRLKNPAAADQWVAFLKDTVCRDKE